MINLYEVIAIENRVPLFFEDHINRLCISIKNYISIDRKILRDKAISIIKTVLKENPQGNIKLTYNIEKQSLEAKVVPSKKPALDSYRYGERVDIFIGERDNPLIKRENSNFRALTESFCYKNNLYDVLLCNSKKHITEGSRSNFLLIDKEHRVITSPLEEALKGVTREKIFHICKLNKIPIVEMDITIDVLKQCQSLIITGTSPEILPIIKCGSIEFNIKNRVIDLLTAEFSRLKKEDRDAAWEIFYQC